MEESLMVKLLDSVTSGREWESHDLYIWSKGGCFPSFFKKVCMLLFFV